MPWQLVDQCLLASSTRNHVQHSQKHFVSILSEGKCELACYSELLKAKWHNALSVGLYSALTGIETSKFEISEQIVFCQYTVNSIGVKLVLKATRSKSLPSLSAPLTHNQASGRWTHTQSRCCVYFFLLQQSCGCICATLNFHRKLHDCYLSILQGLRKCSHLWGDSKSWACITNLVLLIWMIDG